MTDETSLFHPDLFDSLALVELVAWIEDETGLSLRGREAALLQGCESIADIVRFVTEHRGFIPASAPATHADPTGVLRRRNDDRVLPYERRFKDEVVALQAHLWGTDLAVNRAYFEWKYEQNPYVDQPLIYLALVDGRVVGMRGFYGARWEVGTPPRTFLGLCGGDLVVVPQYRNRGLVASITDFAHADLARRGHGYLFNLSAGRTTYLASLSRGWQATLPLGLVCRHARNVPGLSRAEPFAMLDRLGNRHGSDGRLIVTDRPCPQEMAGLVERLEMDGRFRHVRDTRYFAWRFQNPLARYRFILLWEGGVLDGYLVLQTPATGHRGRMAILDWEASTLPGRAELLEAAVAGGQFTDLRLWCGTLTPHDRDGLRSRDFLPASVTPEASAHQSTVLVRALGLVPTDPADWVIGGRRLLDLGNWDVRMLYSDAF